MKVFKRILQAIVKNLRKVETFNHEIPLYEQNEFLYESLAVGFWEYSLKTKEFLWSNQCRKLHQASQNVLSITDWLELIDSSDRNRVRLLLRSLSTSHTKTSFSYSSVVGDKWIDFKCFIHFKRKKHNEIVMVGLIHKTNQTIKSQIDSGGDLLDPKTGAKPTHHGTSRAFSSTNNDFCCFVEIDENGIIHWVNEKFLKMVQGILDDIIGKSYTDLFNLSNQLTHDLRLSDSIATLITDECEFKLPNGDIKYLSHAIYPINQKNGWHIYITDITEFKKRELVLRQDLNKLNTYNQTRTQFVSMASHQFRTPLAIIQTNAELFSYIIDQQKQLFPQHELADKSLSRIHKEVKLMKAMMDDVLLYGNISKSSDSSQLVLVDLIKLCTKTVNDFSKLDESLTNFDIKVTGEAQNIQIEENDIQICLDNLISNAIKYSESQPEILVELNFTPISTQLVIKDNGIGIPPKELEEVLKPFKRASNVGNKRGTGLGLLIVQEICFKYEAVFGLKSNEGKGTEASISFNNLSSPQNKIDVLSQQL